VECTIDNAFNLRDLVLQELVKIIVVCYIKSSTYGVKKGYAPQTCTIPVFLSRCLVMEWRDYRPPIPIPHWKCSVHWHGSIN